MKTMFNTQNGVELNKISPVIKNSKSDLRKEQMAKKLTIMSLILLGNVTWVAPSYGMLNEEDTEKITNVRKLLEAFNVLDPTSQPNEKIAAAQALSGAVEPALDLSSRLNVQLENFKDAESTCQKKLRTTENENQEQQSSLNTLTTRVNVLNINQEKCQSSLQESNKFLIDQNSTHTAERNQWVEEREAFQAQHNNITAQLDTKNREIEGCRAAVQMCEAKNNGIALIRDLQASRKLIGCYEENKNISVQQNEQAIELEKCNVQYHKLENELRWWNDTGRFLQEKTSLFGFSILNGGLYAIPPKFFKDLELPHLAAAAQMIVPVFGFGRAAYTAYTEGDYVPALTLVGSTIMGGLSNLAANHLFSKDSNAPIIIGSLATVATNSLMQGGFSLETMYNIGNGLTAMGGGLLGSTTAVHVCDALKVGDALKPCRIALKSHFSHVTADINNPGNNKSAVTIENSPQDSNRDNITNLPRFVTALAQEEEGLHRLAIHNYSIAFENENGEHKELSFSRAINSLKFQIDRLDAMDLDLNASKQIEPDITAIKNITILLRDAIGGQYPERVETPNLTFKEALANIKEIMAIAKGVEEKVGNENLHLIVHFKICAENIISHFQFNNNTAL